MRISYADVVSYPQMSKKPRNPNAVGYADVYIGSLFEDESEAIPIPTIASIIEPKKPFPKDADQSKVSIMDNRLFEIVWLQQD